MADNVEIEVRVPNESEIASWLNQYSLVCQARAVRARVDSLDSATIDDIERWNDEAIRVRVIADMLETGFLVLALGADAQKNMEGSEWRT